MAMISKRRFSSPSSEWYRSSGVCSYFSSLLIFFEYIFWLDYFGITPPNGMCDERLVALITLLMRQLRAGRGDRLGTRDEQGFQVDMDVYPPLHKVHRDG